MLSNKEQIEILSAVKQDVLNGRESGLCFLVSCELNRKGINIALQWEIKRYIPLFTFENAVKYANGKKDDYGYWWEFSGCYDRYNRIKFLDWIIGIYNSRH